MKFVSTRDVEKKNPIGFVAAALQGLAPDGGLYMQDTEIDLRDLFLSFPADVSFVEMASAISHALFPDEFSSEEAREICAQAFPFAPAIRTLSDEILLLELFHGPSCAFKDFGASYLATIMSQHLQKQDKKLVLLVATSGDTGSAVAQAFYQKKNIEVVILYPSKQVSALQELQLCGLKKNIHACEVLGDFDDCQRMVKECFLDKELRSRYLLSSANSINIGRLIPQAFYYIYAWKKLEQERDWIFCTPSGNFGNLSAGLLAMRWGLPVQNFIAATNKNKVVPLFLESGVYRPEKSLSSLANAMDVGSPSNFERMQKMFPNLDSGLDAGASLGAGANLGASANSEEQIRKILFGAWADDAQISEEIRSTYELNKVFLCPHTAAGVHVAKTVLARLKDRARSKDDSSQPKQAYKRSVVLATAHAGKFSDVIEKIVPADLALPERLAKFLSIKKESHVLESSKEALKKLFSTIL